MKTFTNGNRVATVNSANGRFEVCVGYGDGHDWVAARWFKGFTTCSNSYKSEAAAIRSAMAFVNK